MLPISLLNTKVNIKRRLSTGRDVLNNPTYGTPTSGDGWNLIYQNVPARLAFSSRDVRFAKEGERITPTGVVYINPGFDIKNEDRVLTDTDIEYIVIGVAIGYSLGKTIDHIELTVQLP